jgi:hypothetical protein
MERVLILADVGEAATGVALLTVPVLGAIGVAYAG